MAKSRVEKNKALYEELELESFELEDISEIKKEDTVKIKEEPVQVAKEIKKQELVDVKKEPVVSEAKENPFEDDFVVEQPISYTSKLSVEEILRAKLEKQQKLKGDKKSYKKSPFTDSYTPEVMQKNINQRDGVDVRKEANIKIKKNNNTAIAILVFLLVAVIVAGIVIARTII